MTPITKAIWLIFAIGENGIADVSAAQALSYRKRWRIQSTKACADSTMSAQVIGEG